MTKKILLIVSGIISMALFIINTFGVYKVCSDIFECTELLFVTMMILFPVIPFFILSLITFKMREEIFQAWWKFARIWTVVSMLAILISPSNSHNWILPIEKGTVSFFSSALFVVISLGLIVWEMRKK